MVRWIGLVLMTPKTYANHMCVRQTDKDKKHIYIYIYIYNISLRKKLAISVNWSKINAIAQGGLSKNLFKPWA